MTAERIPLWVDTDIGGDVDDALALTAALRSPEVQLVCVSTVYLRPRWRAEVACELLRRCGADVPVAAGCGEPLWGVWDEKHIPDTGVSPAAPLAMRQEHGCDLLLRQARKTPGMAILAIGPLTNIALALMEDRQALAGCRLFVMGGRLASAQPEWNIQCDPLAAHKVFSSGLDITLVTFEQTSRCSFSQPEVDAFSGTEHREYLRGMMNEFTRRFGFLPILHDPMALAMLVRPQLFRFQRRNIEVEVEGRLTRGALVDLGPSEQGNVTVAADVDEPAFRRWATEKLMDG